MRVLIAEDSALERRSLQRAVEALGHDCLIATDGAEGWALFDQSGADVIVSDWLMPGLDGLELCRRVRARTADQYTYFIFLTMFDDREHALQGMEAGADDFLTKPLNLHDLRMRLIAAARVTQLHRQLRRSEHSRGRLEGVHLAARTIQHELRNALAGTAVYCQMLARRTDLPADVQQVGADALRGVRSAAEILDQLNEITSIAEKDWGPLIETTIDLAPPGAPTATPPNPTRLDRENPPPSAGA